MAPGTLPNKHFARAMSEDQSFEQRVARQAIRSMQASACDLADRVEARQTRSTIDVGLNAPALIMRRRNHWDWLLCHIDPVTKTGFVNVRKTFLQKIPRPMRDIEI